MQQVTVVYRTASIVLSPDKEQVQELVFDSGLKKTGENFLGKLYTAYQKLRDYLTAYLPSRTVFPAIPPASA